MVESTGVVDMDKRTLVIVDDDRSFVEAASIFLEDHGYRTLCAFSSQDALPRMESGDVDLAIIDVHLRDGSGIQLARRIRSTKRIPIILISSDDRPWVEAQCRAAGACAFLTKPLAPEELLDVIFAVVEAEHAKE